MASSYVLKRDEESLIISNIQLPNLLSSLIEKWGEDMLFAFTEKSKYGLIELNFSVSILEGEEVKKTNFNPPRAISEKEFNNFLTEHIVFPDILEIQNGFWFIQQDGETKTLSSYLLSSGLSEYFGKDFYQKVQNIQLKYEENQLSNSIDCFNRL